jgi:hypothetical protein
VLIRAPRKRGWLSDTVRIGAVGTERVSSSTLSAGRDELRNVAKVLSLHPNVKGDKAFRSAAGGGAF